MQVEDGEVFTSGEVTARYFPRRKPGARVYLVGTPSLQDELESHGLSVVGQDAGSPCSASTLL